MKQGGCQCGAVRYVLEGEPGVLYAYHCTECRKQSASAFGLSLQAPLADLRVLRGEPKEWTRPAASGRDVHCFFCPSCGSRLWHVGSAPGDAVSIKAGSLDAPEDFAAAVHIWTKRKLPGVIIPPGAVQYDGEPPD